MLLRFLLSLFAFIGALAAAGALIMSIVLMLRFLPLLIAVVLACWILSWLLNKARKPSRYIAQTSVSSQNLAHAGCSVIYFLIALCRVAMQAGAASMMIARISPWFELSGISGELPPAAAAPSPLAVNTGRQPELSASLLTQLR